VLLLALFSGQKRASIAYASALGLLVLALVFSADLPKYYVVPFYLAPFAAIYGFGAQRGWSNVRAASVWCGLFMLSFLAAQVMRQLSFEFATVGHLTRAMDTCAAVLAPIGFVLLLVAAIIAIALFSRLPEGEGGTGYILAGAAFAGVGAIVGYANWGDWQINRPCL
jgi:hypothetical protein